MDVNRVKELLPIFHAFSEGREIEYKVNNASGWQKATELVCLDTYIYRIKPEPKYRPFRTQEECWEEMLKHEPFGWVVTKNKDAYVHIRSVCGEYAGQPPKIVFEYGEPCFTFEQNFKIYNFADGTPFGLKEE